MVIEPLLHIKCIFFFNLWTYDFFEHSTMYDKYWLLQQGLKKLHVLNFGIEQ